MKGRDAEKYVAGRLEDCGYETYRPPKAKYREQDVFGLYDILAFGHDRLLAIQVKAGRDAAGIQQWFHDASVHEAHIDDLRVAFVHVDGEDCRVAFSDPEGYHWEADERADGDSMLDLEDVVV